MPLGNVDESQVTSILPASALFTKDSEHHLVPSSKMTIATACFSSCHALPCEQLMFLLHEPESPNLLFISSLCRKSLYP